MSVAEVNVNVGSHVSDFRRLDRDRLLVMQRKMNPQSAYAQVDVYGQAWSVAFARLKPGAVQCRAGSDWVPLEGDVIVFLPPFSVVEWGVGSHPFEFQVLMSTEPVQEHWPKQPSFFQAPWSEIPKTFDDLVHRLDRLGVGRLVGREVGASAVARMTKCELDRSYSQNSPIAAMAKKLGFAHAVMTRSFKSAYGLSPVQYRKKLRISESLHLLLTQRHSVTSAALSVGFNDMSRFNKDFKRVKKISPSSFRFRERTS